MAQKLTVKPISDLNDLPKVNGFIIHTNDDGIICDVTLPDSYDVVSKIIVSDKLMKLEFYDEEKNYFNFESEE